ncbi:MAG TPA: CHASE3 domain-containing protein [Polyangiaceae bacterium]|nr:CHASE3 domain-containing protein [Polyangiaceae bacterium]
MASLLKSKRLGWAIIFALVTVMALLSYFTGKRYLAAVRAVEHTMAVESAIDTTLTLLVDGETGHRGFLLTGEEDFLRPLAGARRDLPRRFSTLEVLTHGDAAQAAHIKAIRGLVAEKMAFIAESERLRREGDFAAAIQLVRSGRGKMLMDRIRVECREMKQLEERNLTARKGEAEAAEELGIVGVGAGSMVTVLLALLSLLTVNRDVDELKRAAEELAKSEEHYRLLTEQSSDLVRLLSLDGQTTYVSPSVERMLGYTAEEYKRLPALSIMHPSELDLGKKMLDDVRSGGATGGLSTYRLRHKNGEYRWFEVRWGLIRGADGKPRELHTAARDVTERREADDKLHSYAKQLRSLSIRDELTGLYNRRGFIEVASQAHSQALRDGRPAALIFVDLNGMKRINDELGHDIGDQALGDTADILSAGMRDSDVVGRLGGDEFVVFALDFGPERLDMLRGRLRELSDARVSDKARAFRLSMSVGAAFVDPSHPASLEELLERADASMYQQKKARQAAGGVSIPPPAPRQN